ncbi:hypothetical protein EDB83DRAFT_2529228 [Lactarius deliciosus]|nr:hypothetical protein EDB83DRAFT_2529228 [Lactarius deliciosus]
MLLSHRPKRADVVLFKELLGHLGHKRNNELVLGVAFVPEMPEEFLEEDDVRAFGSMTQEHYDAWRHIEASFPST